MGELPAQMGKAGSAKAISWWLVALFLLASQTVLYLALQLRPGKLAFIPYIVGPKLLLAASGLCLLFTLFTVARNRSLNWFREWRLWTTLAALIVSLSYPSLPTKFIHLHMMVSRAKSAFGFHSKVTWQ